MLELQIESQMQSEREGLCEKHIPNDTEEGHSFFFSIGFHDKKRRTKAWYVTGLFPFFPFLFSVFVPLRKNIECILNMYVSKR